MSGTAILSYIIISLSIVYAFTLPFMDQVTTLRQEKQSLEQVLQQAKDIEGRKEVLLKEFDLMSEEELNKVETLIPTSLNFVKLIADIDSVASRYGISINRVASVDNSLNPTSAVDATSPRNFNSATISLEFSSSYLKFKDFLDQLEKSLRILDVKSVQITTGDSGIYTYRLSFDTYWSK